MKKMLFLLLLIIVASAEARGSRGRGSYYETDRGGRTVRYNTPSMSRYSIPNRSRFQVREPRTTKKPTRERRVTDFPVREQRQSIIERTRRGDLYEGRMPVYHEREKRYRRDQQDRRNRSDRRDRNRQDQVLEEDTYDY